jgi:hypothetical protein
VIHEEMLERAVLNLEQTLTPEEQVALDAHFRECAACREEWARMREAHGALTAWGAESAPQPVPHATRPSAPSGGVPRAAPRVPPRVWPWLAAASMLGILAGGGAGFSLGRGAGASSGTTSDATVDARPLFTLLLEEPRTAWPPTDGGMRPGYVAWRDSLDASGVWAGGARFVPDAGWYVAPSGDALPTDAFAPEARIAPNYSGYFLVRARDYAEAVAIARGSPHLAFGGILVRGPASP